MKWFRLSVIIISLFTSFKASAQNQDGYVYKPESQELYNTIVQMDSVYFNAYNDCNMDKQAAIYADSIEFYHDGSGLETSKKALLTAIKQNICGKVSRVLVKGSIEVYEIPHFGAIEIGLHRFINHAENNSISRPDKFIIVGGTGMINGRLPGSLVCTREINKMSISSNRCTQ